MVVQNRIGAKTDWLKLVRMESKPGTGELSPFTLPSRQMAYQLASALSTSTHVLSTLSSVLAVGASAYTYTYGVPSVGTLYINGTCRGAHVVVSCIVGYTHSIYCIIGLPPRGLLFLLHPRV